MRLESNIMDGIFKEAANISELNSGYMKAKDSINKIKAVISGNETLTVGGKTYKAKRTIRGSKLTKGMIALGVSNKYNQHANLFEILGVTANDESEDVKYTSVAEMMKDLGVNSLVELENLKSGENKWVSPHLVVKDLEADDFGAWFYVFEGRWSMGSGAEPLTFILMEEVTVASKKKADGVPQPAAAPVPAPVQSETSSEVPSEVSSVPSTPAPVQQPPITTPAPVQQAQPDVSVLDALKKGLPSLVTTINMAATQMNQMSQTTGEKKALKAYKRLTSAANMVQQALTIIGKL